MSDAELRTEAGDVSEPTTEAGPLADEVRALPVLMRETFGDGFDGTRNLIDRAAVLDLIREFEARATAPAGLREAAWRLSNAAEMLAFHAKYADDPAHRAWFPSSIGDVDREVRLVRAVASPEPTVAEYAAALAADSEPSR